MIRQGWEALRYARRPTGSCGLVSKGMGAFHARPRCALLGQGYFRPHCRRPSRILVGGAPLRRGEGRRGGAPRRQAKAAEDARRAADVKAAEEARRSAEAKAAEDARRVAEPKAAEDARRAGVEAP